MTTERGDSFCRVGRRTRRRQVWRGRFGRSSGRLEFGPLTPEVLERLAKDFRPEGRQLVGESLAIEYPPALEVHDDEPLMLELMVNPTTGEKLSDVIRVTRTTKSSPEPDRLVVKAAVLKVVAITPVPERLWVWHDAAFEFNHPLGVGPFDALPHR